MKSVLVSNHIKSVEPDRFRGDEQSERVVRYREGAREATIDTVRREVALGRGDSSPARRDRPGVTP